MTRRERRELEERAARAAAQGSSGDTVVVGGIRFHGPAPVSPAVGTPSAPRARVDAPAPAARATDEPRVREGAHRGHHHRAEQDLDRAHAEQRRLAERQRRAQEYRSAQELRAQQEIRAEQERRADELRAHELRRAQERRAQELRQAQEQRREHEHREQVRRAEEQRRERQRLEHQRREQEHREKLRRDQERIEALGRAAHVDAAAAPASAPAATPTQAPVPSPVPAAVTPRPGLSVVAPFPQAAPEALTRAERAGRTARGEPRPERGSRHRVWLPRVAVLGALAAATIAVPVAPSAGDAQSPFDLDLAPSGPSTLDVLSAQEGPGSVAAGIAAEPVLTRDVGASRSQDRDPLPGCDANTELTSSNGKLAQAELCALPFASGYQLSARAAVALTALNEAFRAEFGRDITLVSGYRTIGQQYAVKESRGYLAATPGTSMHGYGLAIDLSSEVTGNSQAYKWLVANGAAYGWENPPWAQRGGSGKYEPWHFEFRPGVEEISTWH